MRKTIAIGLILSCLLMALPTQDASAADWEAEIEISTDIGSENQGGPRIVADGDKLHVIWQDRGDGDYDIFYSLFDGVDWQPALEISTDTLGGDQGPSSVAVADGKVHVVWPDPGDGDYDIVYRTFDGATWQPEEEISTDAGTEDQFWPRVAASSTDVHVVWQDDGDGDNDITHAHFNGTWQPELEICSDILTEDQLCPSVTVVDDQAHVVWSDQGGGDRDILYRHYNGTAWQPEEEISNDVGSETQWCPAIAAEGNRVHVVWHGPADGDNDIYHVHFDGMAWQPELQISTDTGTEEQFWPSIALSGDEAHIIWEDWGDGDQDIYYTWGEDFTPPESNATLSTYWQTATPFDVEWSATDNLGLTNITLLYRHSTDNSSWSDWQSGGWNGSLSGTSAAGTFSFTASEGDGFYEFYTSVGDIGGNRDIIPSTPDAMAAVDLTSPTVLVISPADGTEDVPVLADIQVTFSEPMDASSAENAFSLIADSTEVTGTFSWGGDGSLFTFTPAEDLEKGTTYQIVITIDATDRLGHGLASASETSFTTERAEEADFMADYWWFILLIIIVVAIIALLAAMARRGRPVEVEAYPEEVAES